MRPLTLLSTTCLIQGARPVLGLGQMCNQFKGGFMRTAFLKAADKDEEGPDHMTGFREKLERSYGMFDGETNDPLSAFMWVDQGDGPVNSEDVSLIRALDQVYSIDTSDEADYISYCEGDSCNSDECLIPESFKNRREDAIDVMAFLGIQRAEPVRVKHQTPKEDWQ